MEKKRKMTKIDKNIIVERQFFICWFMQKTHVGQIREKYDLINRIIFCFGSRNISVDL